MLFESSSVGIAQSDPVSRRFQRANAAMCALTGYSEAELLALHVDDLNHPDDRREDRERRDGEVIGVAVTADLVRDRDERPLHSVAMIHDVTRRVLEECLAR